MSETSPTLVKGTPVPATPFDGKMRVDFVTAIADTAKPTTTELNALSNVQLSCYLTLDGWSLTTGQDMISDSRLCSTQTFDIPGRKTSDNKEITVIDNTNTELETSDNKAVETLKEGTTGYFVVRRGLDFDAPYAAGQKLSVYPVRMGEKQYVSGEENSVIRSKIPFGITGPWHTDDAVVTA